MAPDYFFPFHIGLLDHNAGPRFFRLLGSGTLAHYKLVTIKVQVLLIQI